MYVCIEAYLSWDAADCPAQGCRNDIAGRIVGQPPADCPCDTQGVGSKEWDGLVKNDSCYKTPSKGSQEPNLHR